MRKTLWIGLVGAFFSLAATQAIAGWDGDWKGKGTAYDEREVDYPCKGIEIEIQRTAHQLILPTGLDNCQIISSFIDATSFEIQGTTLFWKGKAVGTITDSEIAIQTRDEQEGYRESLDLRLEGGTLSYHDQITADDGTFMVMKGELSK